tara:strand:+ start:3255 stop:3734 length:480 start_codon:yes stop_codon:yes gene_type:complete
MSIKVLGIDPGTHCGWAVLNESGDRDASGVWNLQPGRHQGGGMRFVKLRAYLSEVVDAYKEHSLVLAYEEVRRHRGTTAAHVYGGVVAVITELCEDREIPYQAIPVGTIKKRATGKGNAGKEAVVAAAEKQWPHPISRDDEADALWCAMCLREDLRLGK